MQIINIYKSIEMMNTLMNLKQMIAFKELMRTGTVSEAAKNLRRTQPAISHLIASLEEEVGIELFERRGGRLQPVPETSYLLEECEAVLRRIDLIGENLARMKAKETGELRVVSMPGPSAILLPDIISQYIDMYGDIKTTLLSRSSQAVRQLVSAQQYDLGLADHDPETPLEGTLLEAEIFTFDCLCAIPRDHALAQKSTIEVSDLDTVPLASIFSEHPTYIQSDRVFAQAGIRFDPRYETNLFVMLLTFVQKGQACAIVDPLTAESYRLFSGGSDKITFRPIEEKITFSLEKLTPEFRPASIIASSFDSHLKEKLLQLGATQSG